MPPSIPLGLFELTRIIGRGGMGFVWQGKHRVQGLPVAVKTLRREAGDAESLSLFEREVRAVAALQHPGVVTVLDHGTVDDAAAAASGRRLVAGSPYLVMELCTGGTAKNLIGHAKWPEVRDMLLAVLAGLAHAHARRVVHRDIKPGNILLAGPDDPRPGPKLTDFGIAQTLNRDRFDAEGASESFYGSPSYVAPEQIRVRLDEIGPWTDLYSMACLTWKLTTGYPPYIGASPLDVLESHLRGVLPPFEPDMEVPTGLDVWLKRLLAVHPGDRFQHAGDAAHALRAIDQKRLDRLERRVQTPRDWRDDEPQSTPLNLVGAGLGLFGLRRTGIVGREAERDRLWASLRMTTGRGGTRVVVLRGGAGVGKSRLAEWICDRTEEAGLARCFEAVHSPRGGAADGLAPMVARMLRCPGQPQQAVRWRAEQRLRALGRETPYLWQALAQLVAPSEDVSAAREAGSSEHQAALGAYLAAEASERPLVLWLDDAQWGRAALALVAHLVMRSRLQQMPILLILTVRDEALSDGSIEERMLKTIGGWPEGVTLRLKDLDAVATRRLVEELLGLERRLADRVVKRAGGNPLFATQLVGDWVARGVLELDLDKGGFVLRAGETAPVPDDVHSLWASRLQRAVGDDVDGLAALELGAVLGQEVDLDEWLRCCELANLEVPFGLVGRLSNEGLLRPRDAGWGFVHGMLRESLERSAQEAGRWTRLNDAVAAMLHGRTDQRSRQRRAEALVESEQASEAAAALLGTTRDLLLRRDLDAVETTIDRVETMMDGAGFPWDHRLRSAAALQRSSLRRYQGRSEEAVEDVARIRMLAVDRGWPELVGRALREMAIAEHRTGDLERAKSLLLEAAVAYEEADDREGAAMATQTLGQVLRDRGEYEAAKDTLRRSVALWEALGDRSGVALSLAALASVLIEVGELERAEASVRMAMAGLQDRGLVWPLVGCLENLARTLRTARQWDEARRRALEALELREQLDDISGQALCWNLVGEVERGRGALEEAVIAYLRAQQLYRDAGSREELIPAINLALVELERGRPAAARPILEQARAATRSSGIWTLADQIDAMLLPCLADAGERDAWKGIMDRLQAWEPGGSTRVDPDSADCLVLAAQLADVAGWTEEAGAARGLAALWFRALGDDARADGL